ncbi:hypothetical protein GCM10010151_23920 [Actinoallomurus spadix]|uniref:Uncharacterized protein n=1 Tax=Actinoallomurus spadix TaxID=79912 RepID=A0ABN0WD40_9ACTN
MTEKSNPAFSADRTSRTNWSGAACSHIIVYPMATIFRPLSVLSLALGPAETRTEDADDLTLTPDCAE